MVPPPDAHSACHVVDRRLAEDVLEAEFLSGLEHFELTVRQHFQGLLTTPVFAEAVGVGNDAGLLEVP